MEATQDKTSVHKEGKIGTVHALKGRVLGPVVSMNGAPALSLRRQVRPALVVRDNTTMADEYSAIREVQTAQMLHNPNECHKLIHWYFV